MRGYVYRDVLNGTFLGKALQFWREVLGENLNFGTGWDEELYFIGRDIAAANNKNTRTVHAEHDRKPGRMR
ncbi:hypothetical protein AA0482_2684 [Acetobacter cibinongensis NRIC 0482]|nr:hypothetical protein AA0482_2684 [Acetobacter cibinongensis NRIC 0482]